jgi:phosphoribosyl 1,2-cyclic phosphodiesterase
MNVHHSFHEPLEIGSLLVQALPTSHDAAEPCGFSISDGDTRVTIMTDLGVTDDACLEIIATSQLILIEANHDVQMLKSGPYPAHLKRRVLSAKGHLSNADCGAFLARALRDATAGRTIWLGHLSATNNRPELAVRTVKSALAEARVPHPVVALPRREAGPVWSPRHAQPTAQLSLFGDA